MSVDPKYPAYNDYDPVYDDDDGEDITEGLPDDERPEPSTIPNEHGEYNF